MSDTPTLFTERLELRPLELADSAAVQRLFPHWEIVRHMADSVPWPYPPDGALAFLRDIVLPAVARREEWGWSLRLRDGEAAGELIGCISLHAKPDGNRGFWLGLDWHGRGLMTEACHAVNAYWFDTLGFEVMRVPKAAANLASRRISEREGMRCVWAGEKDFVAGRLPAEIWELTADAWRASLSRSRDGASRVVAPPQKLS